MQHRRKMHATMVHSVYYNNIRICGMDGRGWGVGDGLPMVSRVSL